MLLLLVYKISSGVADLRGPSQHFRKFKSYTKKPNTVTSHLIRKFASETLTIQNVKDYKPKNKKQKNH